MKRNIIGYVILTCTVLLIYSLVFYELLLQWSPFSIVMAVGIIGLLFGLFSEWKQIRQAKATLPTPQKTGGTSVPMRKSLAKNARLVLFVCGAAILTYALSVYVGLGAVVAAGFVGIAAGLLLPNFAAAIYCGSFVGMVGAQVLPLFHYVLLAGLVAGCIFALATDVKNGFGGKLGTIAMAGCLTTMLFTGNAPQTSSMLSWNTSWLVILFTIAATVITYVFNVRVLRNPVLASALVGLAGGLALPHLFPETGSTLAAAVICASFAGMSSQKRAGNEIVMALTGAFLGFVFVCASPYFGGVGGKLGTMAFGSVIAFRGFMDIYDTLKERILNKNKKAPQFE